MISVQDSKFKYSGRLEDQLLPDILRKIDAYKVPGVVQLQNGFVIKKLFLKRGLIIFAMSNQKKDRLGEFLMMRGTITQEQFDEATQRLKAHPTKRFGRILVEMGILTPHQLFQAVLEQIEEIVMSLFEWTEGEVTFIIGDYKDDELIKLNLPIPKAIMRGVHRIPDIPRLLKELPPPDQKVSQHPRLKFELHELGLRPEHRRLLLLLDGKRTMAEIIRESPLGRETTIRLLYGLKMLDRLHLVG